MKEQKIKENQNSKYSKIPLCTSSIHCKIQRSTQFSTISLNSHIILSNAFSMQKGSLSCSVQSNYSEKA
jgi:hypothetical protein